MVDEFDKQIEETLELGLTVGCIISEARKKAKLNIPDISKELKISKKYLEGIEADDYSSFPGDAYIMGFLKNYADYLGLDSDEIFKQLVKEKFSKNRNHVFHKMGQKTKPIKEIKKEDLQTEGNKIDYSSKNLIAFFSATGLLLVILILVILNKWIMDFPKSIDEENNVVIEEISTEKTPISLDNSTDNLINIDEIISEEFSPADEEDNLYEDVLERPAEIAPYIDDEIEEPEVIEEETIIQEPIEEDLGTTYGSEFIKDSELSIKVLEESWIEIYDRDKEKIVFSGIFEEGDSIIVPNEDDLVMKTGNAGGVKLIFKDNELAPIGNRGDISDYFSLKGKYLEKGIYKSTTREDSSWF